MTTRGRSHSPVFQPWLWGFLYALHLLAPAFHAGFLEHEGCAGCEERLERGPILEASCAGPGGCRDTSHSHHRHAHHDDHCVVCQVHSPGLEAGWALVLAFADTCLMDVVELVSAPSRSSIRTRPPARGPPIS